MTNAELAILSLLVEAPRHGYQIEQDIEQRGMREWTEVGFSSIYYLLKKLEDKGLVRSEVQPAEGRGPARKVYHPTEAGRAAWHQGTFESLRTPVRRPAPFLLGLSALPAFDQADALAALSEHAAALEDRREHVRQQQQAQQPLPPHVDALFDYSITLIQAEIDWIRKLIRQLQANDGA